MKIISVNKHTIANNHRMRRNDPPYEVRTSKMDQNPQRVHNATFQGTIRLVYDRTAPLISGAECWLEIDE